jgi:hypothetical protein
MSRFAAAIGLLILVAAPVIASPEATPDELAGILRGLLLKHLPEPLHYTETNWGHTRTTVRGKQRNDGTWRKVTVTAVEPQRSLTLHLTNLQKPEPGRTTFDLTVVIDTRVEFEQQNWKSGFRFYSGSTRATAKVLVNLKCEALSRTEQGPAMVPDLIMRVRVTDANLNYSNLKVEHIAGMGGDAAEFIGKALIATIKQIKPSLERDLLQKGNAAIVKAGDTKEVRISLGAILRTR